MNKFLKASSSMSPGRWKTEKDEERENVKGSQRVKTIKEEHRPNKLGSPPVELVVVVVVSGVYCC
jgi:hypothetical protein